jgi:hypothetical protein
VLGPALVAVPHRSRAPFLKFARKAAARANIKRARPTSSLESLLGRPARSPAVPMTATSALSASKPPSILADRTVLLPGSPATFAHREALKEMGLRWDPAHHRWHGTTTADRVCELREGLGLDVRVFGGLEEPPKQPNPPKPAARRPVPERTEARPHDGSRTRAEARVAFPTLGEEPDEILTSSRAFSVREITTGLPDDCREDDEREDARRIHDLRGRVKAARRLVAANPDVDRVIAGDWHKAAYLYARFGITEGMFRNGVAGQPQGDEFAISRHRATGSV